MRRYVPVAGALSLLVLLAIAVVSSIDSSNFRAETLRPVTHPFRTASRFTLGYHSAKVAAATPSKHLVKSYGNLPLSFEANVGQTDGQVKFLSRGKGYGLFLTGSEAVLTLSAGKEKARVKGQRSKAEDGLALLRPDFRSPAPSPQSPAPSVLRMKVVGANAQAAAKGLDQLPGHSNYYIGNDPKKWRTNVPSYAKVKYEGIYPGVDLVYYGHQRQLEYDFVVAPGADPGAIALGFEGGTAKLDSRGDLVIAAEAGEVRFHKPVVYQLENPKSQIQNRKSVDGSFKLLAANRVGFELGAYDKTRPLVIDPALNYATYLGGTSFDAALAIAADSAGNAYVTGVTGSTDFPASGTAPGGGDDAFVTKLNPTGTASVYTTYLGGTATEEAYGIALDGSGNAYITGDSYSTDFPGATGGDSTNGDAFVTKLNADGGVVFTKLLHGSAAEWGQGIKVDSSGNIYVIGNTLSSDFLTSVAPTLVGFQSACPSCNAGDFINGKDAFVAKLDPTGAPLYGTFLGGNSADQGRAIAIDGTGKIFVLGTTSSTDFPTLNAPTPVFGGGLSDAYLAEIDPTVAGAPSLLLSTYIGDVSQDVGNGIAVDSLGKVYIAGFTDFGAPPSGTVGYVSTGTLGLLDAFVAKVDPTAGTYVYASLFGGTADDDVAGIAIDSAGNAYVAGSTNSSDFPMSTDAVDNTYSGPDPDAYVAQISPDGLSLVFSTYLGGGAYDIAQAIGVTPSGQIFVAGNTESTDFPTSTGVIQPACGDTGGCTQYVGDGFVASYGAASTAGAVIELDHTSLHFDNQLLSSTSAAQTVTLHNTGNATLNITGITKSGENADAFTVTNTCGTSVAADGTCTISATFAPTVTGSADATINIASDATSGPNAITLDGNGVDLTIAPGEGGSTTATVTAGSSATYALSILGTTGATGSATLACSGAPTAATCTVSPTTVTLSDTTAASFTVTVTTTSRALVAPLALKVPPVSGWRMPVVQPIHIVWLLALLGMTGMTLASRRRAKWLLAATMLVVLMWSSCGDNNNPPAAHGTPAGTYTLNVTATGVGGTKTLPLTLTVN